MFLIIIQLFTLTQACDFNYGENFDKNVIFIQSESVGITLFKGESSFQIYIMQNESYAIYNTSLEPRFDLTFDGNFKVNDKPLTAVEGNGSIVLPYFLKMFFDIPEPCTSIVEPIEVCYDFGVERTSLKVILSFLAFMLVITNFKDVQNVYKNIKKRNHDSNMRSSSFSDKFISWRRLPSISETNV